MQFPLTVVIKDCAGGERTFTIPDLGILQSSGFDSNRPITLPPEEFSHPDEFPLPEGISPEQFKQEFESQFQEEFQKQYQQQFPSLKPQSFSASVVQILKGLVGIY